MRLCLREPRWKTSTRRFALCMVRRGMLERRKAVSPPRNANSGPDKPGQKGLSEPRTYHSIGPAPEPIQHVLSVAVSHIATATGHIRPTASSAFLGLGQLSRLITREQGSSQNNINIHRTYTHRTCCPYSCFVQSRLAHSHQTTSITVRCEYLR